AIRAVPWLGRIAEDDVVGTRAFGRWLASHRREARLSHPRAADGTLAAVARTVAVDENAHAIDFGGLDAGERAISGAASSKGQGAGTRAARNPSRRASPIGLAIGLRVRRGGV